VERNQSSSLVDLGELALDAGDEEDEDTDLPFELPRREDSLLGIEALRGDLLFHADVRAVDREQGENEHAWQDDRFVHELEVEARDHRVDEQRKRPRQEEPERATRRDEAERELL